MEQIDVAVAVIVHRQRILICQRKAENTLGGYWEFPGGKREAGETLEQCLAREVFEELAIRVRPIRRLTSIEHVYPTVHVRLHPFLCEHVEGEPQHIECQEALWITAEDLSAYKFPPANESLLAEIIAVCAAGKVSRSDI